MGLFLGLAWCAQVLAAQVLERPTATVVAQDAPLEELVGTHPLTLQWVSWDHAGTAEVTRDGALLALRGRQELKGDYVQVEGVLERVDARSFVLVGTVETRVGHIAGGNACRRQGRFTFRRTGTRRYWRLKERTNPCDGVADYVDLHLRAVTVPTGRR
jgi:hypothetical protein